MNFADSAGRISIPFPKAGRWREMLDADVRSTPLDLVIGADGEMHALSVPSNYGLIFFRV